MNHMENVGLLFDVIGAALLFIYGLPNYISISKSEDLPMKGIEKLIDPSQISPEYKKYKCLSRLGIGLLIAGFLIQILANLLSTDLAA